MIDDKIIQDILDSTDIVAVIGNDITLKKKGVNYIGLCPFHADKDPSFYVSPAKGICKCFACGKGGNAFWYKQEHDGLSFPEAARELGKLCNIEVPMPETTPEQIKLNDDRASAMTVITEAQQIFRSRIQEPEAKKYLKTRKISDEILELYGIGFACDFDGLNRELRKRGFADEHMINAGLAYRNEETKKLKDSFWQRILFPFYNRTGQIVGYAGRAINDQVPKYKNTADTILFQKGKVIYGLNQARLDIQKQDKTYIVEGQFDVLSMVQAGVPNVVAGSGTAFTEYNRRQLHNITSNVVFLYDGDAAGLNAALKLLPLFIQDGFAVRCAVMPNGKDPDDMAKAKGKDLAKWLNKIEIDYLDYLIKNLFKKDDDAHHRLEAVNQIISILVLEPKEIIRKEFLGRLAIATGYALDELKNIADNTAKPQRPDQLDRKSVV